MVRLVGTGNIQAQVLGLLLAELGQSNAECLKVQARDLLVERLGQRVYAKGVLVELGEQLDLRQYLVGEGVAHHERRVARRVTEVQQATLGQHDDRVAIGEGPLVDLRLDRLALDARD